MEQEATFDNPIPIKKIFKSRAIEVATALGGPLVGGYLIAENFKVLNEPEKVRKTWIWTIVATVVIFGGLFLVPEIDKIPNHFIPLINGGIAILVVRQFQRDKIEAFIQAGGKFFSWGRTILISLIGTVVTVILAVGLALLTDTTTNASITTKSYGIMKHEIDFDKSNITESEVDKLADGLRQATFFDDTNKKFVFAKKVGSNYELSISCNKTVKDNLDAIKWFIQLRDDLQKSYPNNKIIFNLVVDNLDNVVKRLE
jgi:hypothetical protein